MLKISFHTIFSELRLCLGRRFGQQPLQESGISGIRFSIALDLSVNITYENNLRTLRLKLTWSWVPSRFPPRYDSSFQARRGRRRRSPNRTWWSRRSRRRPRWKRLLRKWKLGWKKSHRTILDGKKPQEESGSSATYYRKRTFWSNKRFLGSDVFIEMYFSTD